MIQILALTVVFFCNLGSNLALFGYYSIDYWLNAQTGYDGFYDPMFYLNVAKFVPISEMDDQRYRDIIFGFPRGVRGSSLVPTIFYFVLSLHYFDETNKHRQHWQMKIPTQHEYVPIYLDWEKLLVLCDDSTDPLCSWSQFASFADPFMIDMNALRRLNVHLAGSYRCLRNWREKRIRGGESFVAPEFGCNYTIDSMTHYHAPLTLGNCYPIKSRSHMSLIYIFTVCNYYKKKIAQSEFLKRLCPDPCRRQPCNEINFAVDCTPTDIYQDSFQCSCLERFEWDSISKRCVLKNFCADAGTKRAVCNPRGTEKCEFNEVSGSKCICLREYMGFDCSELRDPCIHSENGISGSFACNVAVGNNKCVPINGTNHYICKCGRTHSANPNLPYDNCKKKEPPCSGTLCIFGACRVTEDGNYGTCVCDSDYKGPHCDIPRGSWGAWESWTSCSPTCSSEPQRRRLRNCIGETEDCVGAIEEVETCEAQHCSYEGNPEESELMEMYVLLLTLLKAGSIALFLAIAILVTVSGLYARRSSKAEELAMQAIRQKLESHVTEGEEEHGDLGWNWQWDEDEQTER